MISQVGVTHAEYPAIFPAGDRDLFGVLSAPQADQARGTAVLLLTGGAYIASPNRNRLSVRMARRLASLGFHVLRFDYHGVGESTGDIEGYRLDRPFAEDLEAAGRWLAQTGLRRLVLVGSCFGSRTILAAADRIDGLAGVVLASTPPRDFEMGDQIPSRYAREMTIGQLVAKALQRRVWRNLLAPKNRDAYLRTRHVYRRTATMKARMFLGRLRGRGPAAAALDGADFSPLFLTQFRALVQRRVPLLMLYGTEENFYRDYLEACQGPLRDLTAQKHSAFEVQLVEGVIHGFTTLEVQDAVLERTVAWIGRL